MNQKKATWKLARGKSWRLKLETAHPNHGKVFRVPPRMQKRLGADKMLIPVPLNVEAVMRKVAKGKLITSAQIRERLARDAKADYACPLTTGIFVRIVAEAAEEDRIAGKTRITPYWRTIKEDGGLFEKFPGGVRRQAAKLRSEGFAIDPPRGRKPPKVRDFADHLTII